jgi:hypothetical protein
MMTNDPDLSDDELAGLIRDFFTGRGHDPTLAAAARLVADSRIVLVKVRPFVESDGWIDFAALVQHVETSGWSSGEKAMIRLACSLAGSARGGGLGGGWLLAAMLAPLDEDNARIAVEAVRYAALGPEDDRG